MPTTNSAYGSGDEGEIFDPSAVAFNIVIPEGEKSKTIPFTCKEIPLEIDRLLYPTCFKKIRFEKILIQITSDQVFD